MRGNKKRRMEMSRLELLRNRDNERQQRRVFVLSTGNENKIYQTSMLQKLQRIQ